MLRVVILAAERRDLRETGADLVVIFRAVRHEAGGAVLDAVGRVGKAAAAAPAQRVERAEAEQAVEVLGVRPGVAGEIFAIAVLKKSAAHRWLLVSCVVNSEQRIVNSE